MDYYLAPALALLIVTAAAESPAISKKYRSDYTYDKSTDSFYKLHTERESLNRAQTACGAEGAKLMVAESNQDLKQIQAMFNKHTDLGNLVLIGGITGDDGAANEELLTSYSPASVPEDPDDNAPRPQCEVVNREGYIENYSCDKDLPFVCKVTANDAPYSEECDTYSKDYVSKIPLTGSCYRIARIKANWDEAYANCQIEGAHLAILNNDAEFEIVKDLIEKTPRSIENWQFFVGVRAEEKKEPVVFKTIFNQTLEEVGYQPWDNDEPNNEFGVEYCVALLRTTSKYNDTVCRNRYSYVCEKERRA